MMTRQLLLWIGFPLLFVWGANCRAQSIEENVCEIAESVMADESLEHSERAEVFHRLVRERVAPTLELLEILEFVEDVARPRDQKMAVWEHLFDDGGYPELRWQCRFIEHIYSEHDSTRLELCMDTLFGWARSGVLPEGAYPYRRVEGDFPYLGFWETGDRNDYLDEFVALFSTGSIAGEIELDEEAVDDALAPDWVTTVQTAVVPFSFGEDGQRRGTMFWRESYFDTWFLVSIEENTVENEAAMDTPLPDVGEVTVDGHLEAEVVRQVIAESWDTFQGCYLEHSSSDPTAQVSVSVHFVVGATGVVVRATVEESELGDPEINDCLVNTLFSAAFPMPSTPSLVRVQWVVEFNPPSSL